MGKEKEAQAAIRITRNRENTEEVEEEEVEEPLEVESWM